MDSLREKILNIVSNHWFNDWGVNDAEMCSCGKCPPSDNFEDGQGSKWAEHVVDIFIKELEMTPLDGNYNVAWTRYVTGWLK